MKAIGPVYEKAKAYVDEQLRIGRRHRRRRRISKEDYEQLVRRIARVTPRVPTNGTGTKVQR